MKLVNYKQHTFSNISQISYTKNKLIATNVSIIYSRIKKA